MENGGKLAGVFVGKQKGAGKTEMACAELISDHGLHGDHHAGRDPRRQVSLFALETLNQLHAEGFTVTASQLSANLFTENVRLNSLKPGTRIRIGQALLEIVEARKPCRVITRIDQRLPKRLYGQCGLLARILQGGSIHRGDKIEILKDERQMNLEFPVAD
ncbi:MAG: MOSC domain-containing protein [Blastocatellia bacterium]